MTREYHHSRSNNTQYAAVTNVIWLSPAVTSDAMYRPRVLDLGIGNSESRFWPLTLRLLNSSRPDPEGPVIATYRLTSNTCQTTLNLTEQSSQIPHLPTFHFFLLDKLALPHTSILIRPTHQSDFDFFVICLNFPKRCAADRAPTNEAEIRLNQEFFGFRSVLFTKRSPSEPSS